METVETVVVGAGAVGLAIARALARSGREVVVLEALETFGAGTSSRNSEVIHAGIYYPAASLKARLCVAGKRMLYDYCRDRGVAFERLGKLIVATDEAELAVLARLDARARGNGVHDPVVLDRAEVRAREPELDVAGALFSPSTGIVDSHGLMLALLADAEAAGAVLAVRAPVEAGEVRDDGIALRVGSAAPTALLARETVNAAGLGAPALAGAIRGLDPGRAGDHAMVKGSYFTLAGPSPFSTLVYPVPMEAGLGVHATLDLAGRCRFGPDVEWIDEIDYRVDPARADVFYDAVRRYWPALPDGALQPGYAGVRPRSRRPGGAAADFEIRGPADCGAPGLVNLFGIESPGLTAALAIAELVRAKLDGRAAGGGAIRTTTSAP